MNARTRKFLSYYKPYRRLLLADLACALIMSACALLLPLGARYVTKNVLEGASPDMLGEIYRVGAAMLILIVIYTLANFFVDYQGHMMGAHIEKDMRNELFDHYQTLSFGFYDEQKTGQLMTRITNDIWALAELYHHVPEDLLISLLQFTGAFMILFAIDAELTLAVFLFLPLMVVYAFYFNRRMNRALRISRDRIGDINAQVEDTLAGIRVVKSFTNEAVEKAKFMEANNRFVASRGDGYRSEAYFSAGIIASTHLITLAVIIFGGAAIANASLDLADLLTFLLFVGILIEPIQRWVNIARLFHEGLTGFNRFVEMLEVKPDIVDSAEAVDLPHVQGHVAFREVWFKYKKEHDPVLQNISLEIGAGEFVALVGPSGAGKTTLCSLIPRFYDVDSGQILIDGVNIADISLRSLRANIGIVQQDVYLFAGTVADNIRYGKLDASEEEVIEAAKKANAHKFIMQLPNGYQTDIGQRGIKLSGGQKQRLSVARVFLKDPPILILDEATSALDSESEKAIQEALETLTDNRTTLVIAHRLSTIRNAHRIVVLLADSQICEQGTHDDLLALGGVYARLYHTQFSAFDAVSIDSVDVPRRQVVSG